MVMCGAKRDFVETIVYAVVVMTVPGEVYLRLPPKRSFIRSTSNEVDFLVWINVRKRRNIGNAR